MFAMRFSTLPCLSSLLVILQLQETTCFNEHVEISHLAKKIVKQKMDIALSQPSSHKKKGMSQIYNNKFFILNFSFS